MKSVLNRHLFYFFVVHCALACTENALICLYIDTDNRCTVGLRAGPSNLIFLVENVIKLKF